MNLNLNPTIDVDVDPRENRGIVVLVTRPLRCAKVANLRRTRSHRPRRPTSLRAHVSHRDDKDNVQGGVEVHVQVNVKVHVTLSGLTED